MVNRHMKRWSTSLLIRKTQSKTTVRYHLTPMRVATINKQTNKKKTTSVGEDTEKLEGLCVIGGHGKFWCTQDGKQ